MKGIGALLLGIWLIGMGLKSAIHLNFAYDHLILGVLGVIAGVFVILRQ